MTERARLPFLACLSSLCLFAATGASLAQQDDIGPASKATPSACAKRYHRRLTTEVVPLVQKTQSVADDMRTTRSPSMPGRWLFWEGSTIPPRTLHQQRLLATPLIRREAGVLCTRQVLVRGGRIHCLKWKPIPPGYEPPKFKPAKIPERQRISQTAQKIAAELSRVVISKGAFPELAKGSAFYHRLQRTTDELLKYAGQEYRPTLCTGAQEMVGFYKRQLAPLTQRTNKIQTLVRTLRTVRPRNKPPKSQLGIIEILRKSEVDGKLQPTIERLQTLYQELEQPNATSFREATKEHQKKARIQLQYIELSAYAKYHLQHFQRLHHSFERALGAIAAAQKDECTC